MSVSRDHGHECPGEALGVELEAIIVGAVVHVEDVDHALALDGGVAHAEFGEFYFSPPIYHFFGAGEGGDVAVFFVDDCDVYAFV